MRKVLIIGATSAIAEATARLFAEAGDRLFLMARNTERLEANARDLSIRGAASVATDVFTAEDFDQHQGTIEKAFETLGGLDIALVAHGTLPDQKDCERSFPQTLTALNTNAISVISVLTVLANAFEAQGSGVIAVISSVAGDRGRQSNYVYSSAKSAVTVFLQGLRNRLAKSGVHVLTIKPGFVDTPMTSELKKGILWAQPEKIASIIVKSIARRRNVVYAPAFWRPIMILVRLIPENIFKKMSL